MPGYISERPVHVSTVADWLETRKTSSRLDGGNRDCPSEKMAKRYNLFQSEHGRRTRWRRTAIRTVRIVGLATINIKTSSGVAGGGGGWFILPLLREDSRLLSGSVEGPWFKVFSTGVRDIVVEKNRLLVRFTGR